MTPAIPSSPKPLPDDIPTLDEIKAGQGPLIAAIKSGWRVPAKNPDASREQKVT